MRSPAPRRKGLVSFVSSSTKGRVAVITTLLAVALLCLNLTTARLASPKATASVSNSAASLYTPALAPLPLVVNTTNDSNDVTPGDDLCLDVNNLCSLRAAIEEANANSDPDTINFLIPGAGVQTITPTSALPQITETVTIDGYTQPTSSQNTLAVGNNAVINIQIDGTSAGASADGLNIAAGSCVVTGLAIYKFGGDGIEINTTGGATISGNYIGTNATGAGTTNGNGANGVNINNIDTNLIGGSTPQERNVISANAGEGVNISGSGATLNLVVGNYIGTDRNGTADVGNGVNGVLVTGPDNAIGADATIPGQELGNVISGNGQAGVRLSTGSDGSVVYGNIIGLRADGSSGATAPTTIPNSGEAGVFITNGATNVEVGCDDVALRNIISGNTGDGVEIDGSGTDGNFVHGNYIGTDIGGTIDRGNGGDGVRVDNTAKNNQIGDVTSTPGTVPGNVISGNESDGIEINSTSAFLSQTTIRGNIIGLQANGTSALPNSSRGVNITGGSQSNTIGGSTSTARNIISGNTGTGIEINASNSNNILGNYIGTSINGTTALANSRGILLTAGAQSNIIGNLTSTPGTAPGNVISGNTGNGIEIASSSNTVRGNLVGFQAGGTALLRNGNNGIIMNSSGASNTIGGSTSTARNVITGGTASGDDAIEINGASASGNTVAGNYIGTDINGTGANGGASDFGAGGDGVRIIASSDNNTIGGSTSTPGTAPGNVISGNTSNGIEISGTNATTAGGTTGTLVQGNLIGTQVNGTTGYGNGAEGVFLNGGTLATIGGATATPGTGLGNVISANTDGIRIAGTSNSVQGNLIGLQAGGTAVLGNTQNGILVTTNGTSATIGGATSNLRNIISGNTLDGIQLDDALVGTSDNVTIASNYIGTDITGAVDLGNTVNGIDMTNSDAVTVGGIAPTPGAAPGNLISGNNTNGIRLNGANLNFIRGNLIGTKINGTEALPNTGDGINIIGSAPGNTIGGTVAGHGNVISGNTGNGINFAGSGNTTTIQGNLIGTNITATGGVANGGAGVRVQSSANNGNVIGGTITGAGNIIAFNTLDGVNIVAGTGTGIRRNSIYSNNGLGIDLDPDGVTPNDVIPPIDADTGPNNLQNFPVITSAVNTGSMTSVQGNLNSTPSTTFDIEIFSNAVGCDGSGNGEGQTFLGTTTATTDASGNASFNYAHGSPLAVGSILTATATNTTLPAAPQNTLNNTSEFSACATVVPAVTIDDVMYAEGNTQNINALITVRLSASSPTTVTVQFTTVDDTAISTVGPLQDYTSTNGEVNFIQGATTATISVPIIGDVRFEGNEQFLINLTGVSTNNAVITDAQSIVTINDDEPTNADFDGDGLTDASVWRSSEGNWYWIRSSDSTLQTHVDWGRDTFNDIAVPGDYDGDNKTDLAVWRPSEGNWYIVNSSFGSPGGSPDQTTIKGWGAGSLGDVPVPADYDGDGKTDLAVWRGPEGNWYILNSSNNTVTTRGWGSSALGDKPVLGDYDGDGKTDIAVWRPAEGNWYILNSSTNTMTLRGWGTSLLGDQPVQADYDGDGKTDLAVWRPSEGNWYILNSRDDSTTVKSWGSSSFNDVPVPGNYDGDNKADIAIWRPAEGNWYIISSRDNVVITLNLGLASDTPIPAEYIP